MTQENEEDVTLHDTIVMRKRKEWTRWRSPEGDPLKAKTVQELFIKANRPLRAPELLEEMAKTFRERNKVYGDNYKTIGAAFVAMFPNGIELKTEKEFNIFHIFTMVLAKLTRAANSNLSHIDSVHDIGTYAAIWEELLRNDG